MYRLLKGGDIYAAGLTINEMIASDKLDSKSPLRILVDEMKESQPRKRPNADRALRRFNELLEQPSVDGSTPTFPDSCSCCTDTRKLFESTSELPLGGQMNAKAFIPIVA